MKRAPLFVLVLWGLLFAISANAEWMDSTPTPTPEYTYAPPAPPPTLPPPMPTPDPECSGYSGVCPIRGFGAACALDGNDNPQTGAKGAKTLAREQVEDCLEIERDVCEEMLLTFTHDPVATRHLVALQNHTVTFLGREREIKYCPNLPIGAWYVTWPGAKFCCE